ncbi:MAG: lipoyl synthase, partial [Phycisphaerales bacterium]
HSAVRPQATYDRSMQVLTRIQDSGLVSKTGIMVGIGETDEEVLVMLADIREKSKTEIITIGQYLQPSRNHLPIDRWVHPDQFAVYKEKGLELGFRVVESGPLVRSSYHAEEQVREFKLKQNAE